MTEYIYDRVPYDIRAYPNAHLRNLAAIGMLYGLQPVAIDRCRVLVLGCAQGGNLFPAAVSYPESRFVGIDNSERQIQAAQSTVDQLGLNNTELHCMDILDIDAGMGQFDYVIAHGVYSWVPAHVRDKVFQLCKTHLTPNGIAYLSYNTLPGWHIDGIVRDIMLYKFNEHEDPEEGLNHALSYLEKITGITSTQNNPYMALLKQLQTQVNSKNHSYLLHDHLEETNDAFYFHEIVKKGQSLHLQYLGDATFIGKEFTSHSPDINNKLNTICRDMIDFEQSFDFISNRTFRSSIFCHNGIALRPTISGDPAWSLYFSSLAQVTNLPDNQYPAGVSGFRNSWGSMMIDPHPLFQGAMKHLVDIYPQAVTFTQLVETQLPGYKLQTPPKNQDVALLYAKLLRARAGSLINITVDKPAVVSPGRKLTPGYRPLATPFARIQAQSGDVVVSAWNENIGLNDFSRQALALLDGNRRIQDLKKEMLLLCKSGALNLTGEDAAINLNEVVEQRLGNSLEFFAKSGLLVTQ